MLNPILTQRLTQYESLSRGIGRKLVPGTKTTLAMGMGLLAGIPVAEAAIVYSGVQNLPVAWMAGASNAEAFINLNGNGNDFRFFGNNSDNQPVFDVRLVGGGAANGVNASAMGGFAYPFANTSGAVFNASDVWQGDQTQTLANSRYNVGNFQALPNGTTRFVGVRLTEGGCDKYGWIRITKNNSRNYTIVDWAYENDCNTQILAGSTLPVELSAFTTVVRDQDIRLNWTTATEQNNAGFEVQRSTDGREFSTIAFVEGTGTSTREQTYFYDDKALRRARTYFYRLKQIDFDGTFAFSELVSVELKGKEQPAAVFSPNPAHGRVQLSCTAVESTMMTLTILDVAGRTLLEKHQELTKGDNLLSLDLSQLNPGIYIARINTGDKTDYQQLVVE